ncbi:MAG: ATPase, T2SS/T4P/T4SS family [Polyangiales bacterium]
MSGSKPPLGARPSRGLDPRREDDGAPSPESFDARPSPPDRAPRRAIVEERVSIPSGAEDRLRRRPVVEERVERRPTAEEPFVRPRVREERGAPGSARPPRPSEPVFFPDAATPQGRIKDESVIARVQVPPPSIAHEELPIEPTFTRTSWVQIPDDVEPLELNLIEEKDSRPPERRPSAAPVEVEVAPIIEAHAPERPIRPLWTDPMSLVQEWVVLPDSKPPPSPTFVAEATRAVEEIEVAFDRPPPVAMGARPTEPELPAAEPRPTPPRAAPPQAPPLAPQAPPLAPQAPPAAPGQEFGADSPRAPAVPRLAPEVLQTLEALAANPTALSALLGDAPTAKSAKPAASIAPGAPGQNRIDRFLKLMNDRGASDLHLSVGRPPIFRLSGRMEPIRYRTLDNDDFRGLVQPIAPPHLWAEYLASGDMDFAYEVPGLSRFRVNLFKQERGMGAVFRIIPTKLMTVAQLGLPEAIKQIVSMRSGLVLVTGPTGSGKSTTLSAIINEMNATRRSALRDHRGPHRLCAPQQAR